MSEQRDEVKRLRWMLQYASEAPDLAAAQQICRDALNGVGGAYNVQEVRSEIKRETLVLERGLRDVRDAIADLIVNLAALIQDIKLTGMTIHTGPLTPSQADDPVVIKP